MSNIQANQAERPTNSTAKDFFRLAPIEKVKEEDLKNFSLAIAPVKK